MPMGLRTGNGGTGRSLAHTRLTRHARQQNGSRGATFSRSESAVSGRLVVLPLALRRPEHEARARAARPPWVAVPACAQPARGRGDALALRAARQLRPRQGTLPLALSRGLAVGEPRRRALQDIWDPLRSRVRVIARRHAAARTQRHSPLPRTPRTARTPGMRTPSARRAPRGSGTVWATPAKTVPTVLPSRDNHCLPSPMPAPGPAFAALPRNARPRASS